MARVKHGACFTCLHTLVHTLRRRYNLPVYGLQHRESAPGKYMIKDRSDCGERPLKAVGWAYPSPRHRQFYETSCKY